jgi:hypothetical protein
MAEFSQELFDKICDRIANGETLLRICQDDDMPNRATVWRWMQENEELRNISARAREDGSFALADECLKIADDEKLDPKDKRVRIDTRVRLMGFFNRKQFGDKLEVDGKVAFNVTMSDDDSKL